MRWPWSRHENAPPERVVLTMADVHPEVHAAGMVRGRHFTEWVPTLNEWRAAGGHDDESLDLLLEIIEATERVLAVNPNYGLPPGYTRRAAIIYRRRRDYAAELAILDRFLALDPNPKIAERRARLLEMGVL